MFFCFKLDLKIFQIIWFTFFQIQNFTSFWCPRQPNFTPFRCPRQPNFTPLRCPRQPNFSPFGCPRQLLWTPLEGWGKAGAWQKVSLLKLRNTGAPSIEWGALLYIVQCKVYTVHCTVYTVYCTLYIVHCILYTVHCKLYTVHCTLYTVHRTLYTVHCTLYTVHCTLYTVHPHLSVTVAWQSPVLLISTSAEHGSRKTYPPNQVWPSRAVVWDTKKGVKFGCRGHQNGVKFSCRDTKIE